MKYGELAERSDLTSDQNNVQISMLVLTEEIDNGKRTI